MTFKKSAGILFGLILAVSMVVVGCSGARGNAGGIEGFGAGGQTVSGNNNGGNNGGGNQPGAVQFP